MFPTLQNEIPGQRYLFVQLEAQERNYGSDWRHIRAIVLRDAKSHILLNAETNHWQYHDEQNATGFRHAMYSSTQKSAVYVGNMELRGQIDVGRTTPLNNGRPYANRVRFTDNYIEAASARAMANFFNKQEAFYDKNGYRTESDSFIGSLYVLAQFLKIDKFLFAKHGYNGSFQFADGFEVCNWIQAEERINEILQPFYCE